MGSEKNKLHSTFHIKRAKSKFEDADYVEDL
jgi:hypothetical protein